MNNKYSPKRKDDFLGKYYTDERSQWLVIILGSSLILIMALVIIIIDATTTNRIYQNEELLQGYIPINSMTAKYIIENSTEEILLFNKVYCKYIYMQKIDGNQIQSISNKYKFDSPGEHTMKIYLKKKLISTNEFFLNFENLIEVNLTNITSHKIKTTADMFHGCSNLQNVVLSNFDSTNLKNISNMFYGCSSLNSINIIGFDGPQLKDISGLFMKCTNLTDIYLNNINTRNVINKSNLFYECESFY